MWGCVENGWRWVCVGVPVCNRYNYGDCLPAILSALQIVHVQDKMPAVSNVGTVKEMYRLSCFIFTIVRKWLVANTTTDTLLMAAFVGEASIVRA